METVRCAICEEMKPKQECTRLIGLGATPDGWECADCDQAAREAKKVYFEYDSLGDHYND